MEWLHSATLTFEDMLQNDARDRDGPEFGVIVEVAHQIVTRHVQRDRKTCLQILIDKSHQEMQKASSVADLDVWRKVYTDCSILKALCEATLGEAYQAISSLDYAIIIAGATGNGRLDFVHYVIQGVQSTLDPRPLVHTVHRALTDNPDGAVKLPKAGRAIRRLSHAPSFLAFQSNHSNHPFIIPGFAKNWPALMEHPWHSATYLRSVAGPGRVVPVEVGKHYLAQNWRQVIMGWDEFLSSVDLDGQCMIRSTDETLYLAQHNLFMQFPSLRDDIIVPDYVYASLVHDDYPSYRRPDNDEQLLLNSWLGPANTISPAHFDPYNNFYVQIVGRKTIWLAPPSVSQSMQLQPKLSDFDVASPNCCFKNTSTFDVFDDEQGLASFASQVVPHAMNAVLNPGDVLYIPAGWWHAMRSEETSCSVSIWF